MLGRLFAQLRGQPGQTLLSIPVGRRSPAWGLAGGFLVPVLVGGWLWFFVPTGGKVLMGVTATVMMLAIMLAVVGGTDIRLSEGGILWDTLTPWSDVLAFRAEGESIQITSVSHLLNTVDDVWELPTGDRTAEALGILRERASRARETG